MMNEEKIKQEVRFYQQAITKDVTLPDPYNSWYERVPELTTRFRVLMEQDFQMFRYVCFRLLEDERYEIRLGVIRLLQLCKRKDDILSMLLVMTASKHKDLRDEALSALMGVRTRRVLPQLLMFAEKGYWQALYTIRRILQTPEEIEQGIRIARIHIAAKDYELREGALFLLQRFSSMDQEAERVLVAVQKYLDELFIDALKAAPPESVLEPLKVLRATIEARYAEHQDLSKTIAVLKQKAALDG